MPIGHFVHRAVNGLPHRQPRAPRALDGFDQFLAQQRARVRWTLKRHVMRAAITRHGADGGGESDPLTLVESRK